MPVTFQNIQDAAQMIEGCVARTPCTHSRTLSKITGAEVFLKFESHQFTGSFKERGALAKLLSVDSRQQHQGVIAMSAGNHAQAVAYHAQRLGIPATIVMPRLTPNVKVEHTRMFGAHVVLQGQDLEESAAFAQAEAREKGLEIVHPYDDATVIAGQGTCALEILADCPDLDVLVVPIGGGGLIAGCAIAAKALRPHIDVIGVQAARYPSMRQALDGQPVQCGASTVAEGIAVKAPGYLTTPIIRTFVHDVMLVEERDIEDAVLLLLEVEKTVVEGAGAVGLAALLRHPHRFRGRKIGLILSGGNIDMTVLSSIIQRGLVRSSRLVRVRAELPDRPGALGEITRVLGEVDANIVEIIHHRSFTKVPLKSAEVEIVIQTRGASHLRDIEAALKSAGFVFSFPEAQKGSPPRSP